MPVSVRPTTIQPITLRHLTVLRVEDVTPTMRRVVLGGEELEAFERDGLSLPAFASLGFDDHIKFFFPDPVTGDQRLPIQLERRIEWPDDDPPISRSYTVRSFDADAGEVAIDFVVHVAGVATGWSLGCAPGDKVHLAGPKMGLLLPESTDWLLLAGDETALPAIARGLEELPAGARAQVLVEVGGPESELQLATDADVTVRWLHRDGREPGTTTLLEDAIRDLDWWPGEAFAWVAGETMTLRPIRRLLREERGMPRERLDIAAYWRRREHDPGELLEEGMGHDVLEELGDLLAPHAVRAAVTLGVGDALRAGAMPLGALAERCGADPAALRRLLRYLGVHDLVEQGPAGYALTASGIALAGEGSEQYDLRRPLARLDLAAAGLLEAVRTGRPGVAAVLGAEVAGLRDTDPAFEHAWNDHARDETMWVAPSFGAEVPFAEGERVLCCGDGVLALLETALRADAGPHVSLLAPPSRVDGALAAIADGLRDRVELVHGSELDGWPARSADAVVIAGLLERLPDADAAHALRRAAAALRPGGRMLVIAEVLDEAEVDDHDAEEDLMLLCLHGSGMRSRAEWDALFAETGLGVEEQPVGWGRPVFVLT